MDGVETQAARLEVACAASFYHDTYKALLTSLLDVF